MKWTEKTIAHAISRQVFRQGSIVMVPNCGWMAQEDRIHSAGQIKGDTGKFRSDRPSYKQMYEMAINQVEMFPYDQEPIEDCACTD